METPNTYTSQEIAKLLAAGEGRTDWVRLHNMTEEEITANAESDTASPPITEEDFTAGTVRRLHVPEAEGVSFADRLRAAKSPTCLLSVRYDSDILEWYKRHGKGYQSLMNTVLRAYMEAQEAQQAHQQK